MWVKRPIQLKFQGELGVTFIMHLSSQIDSRRSPNAMIFVLDSPEVLMRRALRYEHDRFATTIDSRRCEWRDQYSKNSRENWGLPSSCIYRPKSIVDAPQTPWYSCWTHLRCWWGQSCDMSTIDLRQQSIQGVVSEATKTVEISGRIGGYLHHASIVLNW